MFNNRFTTFINYLFLFLVINYTLVVRFLTHIDYTGYGLVFLSLLVLIANNKETKSIINAKPVVFWFIWCIYAVLNCLFQSSAGGVNLIVLYRRVFVPLIALVVVIKEWKSNSHSVIVYLTLVFLLFTFFGSYYDRSQFFRYEEDNATELGNAYAITTCFSLFYLALMNRIGKCKLLFFIVFAIILIVVLALVGTRKAFGAGVIMLLFWFFSIFDKKNRTRSLVLFVVLALFGVRGYGYLDDNTFIGQRMDYYEDQQEDYLPANAPHFLSIFGDRASHYYYGWKQFLQKPVFGVGLLNSRVGNSDMYIHSEYMAQLTDNGILGFGLLISMYIWIIKKMRILLKNKVERRTTFCVLGGFFAILFLNLTAWMWEFPAYFTCLGVIIAYAKYGFIPSNHSRVIEKK